MIKTVTIRDIMITDVFTLAADMEIIKAMRELLDRRISGAPILDASGNIAGVLSKKDCIRAAINAHYHHVWGGKVGDYMTEPVETMDVDTDLVSAGRIFTQSRYRRFPVLEQQHLVGQVSRSDVLNALCRQWGNNNAAL